MGYVSVDELKPGMTLDSDVTNAGRLLMRSGTVLNEASIRMFRNRGVTEVDIQGVEEEVAEPETESAPDTVDAVQPDTSVADEAAQTAANPSALAADATMGEKAPREEETRISKEDEPKIKIMRATSFFEPFSDRELPVILESSTWLKCATGDIILREGESSDPSFFVVLKGSICIQKKIGGTSMKKTLHRINRGECFGEMSVIAKQPRSADAVAEGETYVLKIDADTLNKETDSFALRSIQFKFYKIFSEILAQRLTHTTALACKLT